MMVMWLLVGEGGPTASLLNRSLIWGRGRGGMRACVHTMS
jgi:hypothetical protein